MENRHNTAECGCKDGFFEEDKTCKKCVRPCNKCSSVETCITRFSCNSPTSGLFWNGSICEKCPFPCKTCDNGSTCLSCGY